MPITKFSERCLTCLAVAVFSGGAALAQNNQILIEQIAPVGASVGNTLIVDQSAASNSLVAGAPNGQNFELLVDQGTTTTGTIDGNTINVFSAEETATQFGSGNRASIALRDNGTVAGLEQIGNGNFATIDVSGDNAFGSIIQQGDRNRGTLTVAEAGGLGELIQIGNDNDTVLSVAGNPNSAVSFTVQGNGVTTNVPASVVTSSGGQVTIIQRQFNSFTQ